MSKKYKTNWQVKSQKISYEKNLLSSKKGCQGKKVEQLYLPRLLLPLGGRITGFTGLTGRRPNKE